MSEDKTQDNKELTAVIMDAISKKGEKVTDGGKYNEHFGSMKSVAFDFNTCTEYTVDVPNGSVKAQHTPAAQVALDNGQNILKLGFYAKDSQSKTKRAVVVYNRNSDGMGVIGGIINPLEGSSAVMDVTEASEMYNQLARVICSHYNQTKAKEEYEQEQSKKAEEAAKKQVISNAKDDVLAALEGAAWPELEIKKE